eukprot:scaffold39676_cov16-Tisochrysis_lutea.AAC.1
MARLGCSLATVNARVTQERQGMGALLLADERCGQPGPAAGPKGHGTPAAAPAVHVTAVHVAGAAAGAADDGDDARAGHGHGSLISFCCSCRPCRCFSCCCWSNWAWI